ncbi:(2Fe-2S)-binding protein [Comamonas testosteroni]|uniref:(2Fe-2S)-binding protein n=1 Tax=Comamonas testosteroni TaxID=285 RepID=UPI0023AAC38E|nr:(2Fe-2S)-binding protein [Comamonas testosteroni]WEE76772.1 (2Fe-2S)-binding protein [Comamonas testosteroni]
MEIPVHSSSPTHRIPLQVNARACEVPAAPGTALLHVLRNDLELNGPKYGCGLGECGACTVLIDGVAARSCVIPVKAVVGREVTTLEGLGSRQCPGPTQQAFIDCQAAQCGYCLSGMIMTVEALLRRNPNPTEQELRNELHHNLCRCGTHVEIMQAALRAVQLRAERAALQAPRSFPSSGTGEVQP